jgi:hypothetical protein
MLIFNLPFDLVTLVPIAFVGIKALIPTALIPTKSLNRAVIEP